MLARVASILHLSGYLINLGDVSLIDMLNRISFICCLMFIGSACDSKTSSPTPEQLQHMIQFREQLEHKLGDMYALAIKPGTEEQRMRGQELYRQICAPCHGVRGRGDGHTAQGLVGNPSDLTDAEQASFYSEQARLYILRKGVDGTPMMGWENVLTEADIMAVYLYIRSLIKRK